MWKKKKKTLASAGLDKKQDPREQNLSWQVNINSRVGINNYFVPRIWEYTSKYYRSILRKKKN